MTGVGWTLTVLLSHWRRHPMQLATLLIGLISATALWSGVQALNQQARASYDRAAAAFGGARTPMLEARQGAGLPQQIFVDLRRAGWPVSPMLEGRLQIGGRSYRLLGIEPVTLPVEVGAAPTIGKVDLQSFITPPGQTLVAPETLSELDLPEGATPEASDGTRLPPLRKLPQLAPGVLVVDISIAQNLLHRPNEISSLLVGKAKGPHAPLESIAGDRLRLVPADSESDLERLTDSFHLNLTAFGLLSFFVGLFIVNSAIGLAFEQRLPMLRTLRACGVSARKLNVVLVLELVMLALLAGLIGLVCGYLIAAALLPDVAVSLRSLYGAEIPGELTLKPQWWFAGLAISVIGALVAAAASLLKAMRLSVLATAQPQAWLQAQHRWLMLQAASAVAAFAAAALLLWFGDSLSGFAVIAALLLGGALILPAMLEMVLSLGQRSTRQALATWFWADSRQQLSGLSLALMALLLALAVNVGVGTMVKTFSRTFATWLDGRLAADVYVNASDNAQADDIKAWLRLRPEVQAILPGGRAETQLDGAPIEIVGLPDHAAYRDHWALLQSVANAWVRLRPGEAGFVSEQLARRLNLKLGDRIELPVPGGIWTLEIVGIYADYGNPKGEITVNIAALLRHFPAIPQTRMGLRVTPTQIPALMTALQTKYGLNGRNLVDQGTLKADLTRIFNRTFAVTAALNAFTLGIAGIALLTSLLTLGHSRLPQLAPLWAIGITRRHLALIELLKTMSVALFTTLLALPLGLCVAWCLIAVVNVKAFGWRLPFAVFPLQLMELVAVAMFAALAAALVPAIKLARMQPASLIKIFADEQ